MNVQKSYWYFVSQLPSLREDENLISEQYFFDLCDRFLSANERKIVHSLSLVPPKNEIDTGSPFLNAWYDYERSLRFALENFRSQKLQKEKDVFTKNISADIVAKAKDALAFSNPLEAEQFLYRTRLSFLDSIKPLNAFSLDAIFEYGIRLLLFLRMKKFSMDEGRVSYKKIYESILGE